MATFLAVNEFLVAISVVISAVSSYLIVNKLWSRRTMKDVSESISVSAALLGLATGVPFFIQFLLIDQSPPAAIKSAVGIGTGIVFVLIGAGFWVSEYRDESLFRLLVRALNLERRESADLLKALVQPQGADHLLEIFQGLARVDADVHERELELLKDFARRWHLPEPEVETGAQASVDVVTLRRQVVDYLSLTPPKDQVAELLDVMRLFVEADDSVSAEEEMIVEEVTGLVSAYLARDAGAEGGGDPVAHEVVIVPQTAKQTDAVRTLLPTAESKTLRGGQVFSVGRYYSPRYAEMICARYIALGLFTTRVDAAGARVTAPTPT